MKRTTRFITLVLTLILALSCSMQIFAEEVDPYALRICRHEICSVEPNVYHDILIREDMCDFHRYEADKYTCINCKEVTYIDLGYIGRVTIHDPGDMLNGRIYCTRCFIPLS